MAVLSSLGWRVYRRGSGGLEGSGLFVREGRLSELGEYVVQPLKGHHRWRRDFDSHRQTVGIVVNDE